MFSCRPCFFSCSSPPPPPPLLPSPPANAFHRFFLDHTLRQIHNPECCIVFFVNIAFAKIESCASTVWPSGLRRWTQVPLSSDAWVRTPQPSYCAHIQARISFLASDMRACTCLLLVIRQTAGACMLPHLVCPAFFENEAGMGGIEP